MKQLALFTENPQIAEFAPEPPRNPDPPPLMAISPPGGRSLSSDDSEDNEGKIDNLSKNPASTLRDKLMGRRRRELRQTSRDGG